MSTAAVNLRTRRTPSRDADVELGKRAHMLIWSAGRTHTAVAEAIGIEPTAFGKKLKGRSGWALQEVKDLAVELHTTVGYLFGETENPRQSPDGGSSVGPAGIEPTTSTVEDRQFVAPVIPLRRVA